MDFVDKKEDFANLLEQFNANEVSQEDVLSRVKEFSQDEDFKEKPLFENIFNELQEYIQDLSRKEIKQRILLIRSYLE